MILKQLITIPDVDSEFTLWLITGLLIENEYILHSIYHTFEDVSGCVVIEVSKIIDPIIVTV